LRTPAGKIDHKIEFVTTAMSAVSTYTLLDFCRGRPWIARPAFSGKRAVAIEGAKYSPSLELALRIAAAFKKPLEEVFQYEPAANSGVGDL